MSIAFVAAWTGNTNAGGGTTLVLAGVDSSGGNFVAVTIATNGTIPSVTDSKGNTYTRALGPLAASTDNVYVFYAENATCGSAHTITINIDSSGRFTSGAAAAYSGMNTSSTLDKTANAGGSGTALDSGATATISQADELVIGAGTVSTGSNSTFSAGTNFTMRSQYGNASASAIVYCEERIVSAAAGYNAPATWNGTGGAWEAAAVTFKGTSGGGGGPTGPPPGTLMQMGMGT